MSYMENKNNKIALLIDGDNAQPKLLKPILEESSKYGKVTIRRIYGDWTKPQMNGWKDILNELAFNPIQKFSYTTGKNSTDSALIIDAMDILHDSSVDGFCIVSSDSDYTGLAKRIREEGTFVMGIGEKKTPGAFVKSCEIFTFCENLESLIIPEKVLKENKKSKPYLSLIDKAFDMSVNESDEAYVATIGLNIRKLDPSFDSRTYGYKSLTSLLSGIQGYELIDNFVNGLNHPLFRKKIK